MIFTALLGNPVEHSVAPYLYAELAKFARLEFVHLKLKVPTEEELPVYLDSLQQIKCAGVNITLPYKLSVIKHLDVQDERSQAIGAVNTVVMTDNKKIGYNTDGIGAYRAIATHLRPVEKSDRIVILGSGGAARAIIYELYQYTDNIVVLGINREELEKLANNFIHTEKQSLIVKILDENTLFESLINGDFLINATPIGMYPDMNQSLLTSQLMSQIAQKKNCQELFVFDAIANPHTTQMLRLAAQRGAHICSGVWMMIYQAVECFHLWTGQDVSNAPFNDIETQLGEVLIGKLPLL